MGLLAWAEVRRAPLRSALLAGAVALLAFLIVFQQGLLTGLVGGLVGGIRSGDGQVLVLSDQAQGTVPASFITPEQAQAVEAADGVGAAGQVGVAVLGVQAAGEPGEITLVGYELDSPGGPPDPTDGRLPSAEGEVVVAPSGDTPGFDLGDEVRLDADGSTHTVVGIARGAALNALPTLYAPYAVYESARLAENPEAPAVLPTILAVEPADGVTADGLARTLSADVDGVAAVTRAVAAEGTPGIDSIGQSFQLIFALVFIVATLVVSLSFQIVTAQKSASLALLRALGRPSGELVGALMIQVLVIVGAGALVGAAAGLGLSSLIDVGLDAGTSPLQALASTAGIVGLSLLGALAAARQIWRVDPLSATSTQGLGL